MVVDPRCLSPGAGLGKGSWPLACDGSKQTGINLEKQVFRQSIGGSSPVCTAARVRNIIIGDFGVFVWTAAVL